MEPVKPSGSTDPSRFYEECVRIYGPKYKDKCKKLSEGKQTFHPTKYPRGKEMKTMPKASGSLVEKPYDPDKPPAKLNGMSAKKKRQWVHVFISCWKKHKEEGRCHAMAYGAVKKSTAVGYLEEFNDLTLYMECPSCHD